MTVVTPQRSVRLITQDGVATPRFASFLDDTIDDLNEVTAGVALVITEDSVTNVTFTDGDAFTARRKVFGALGQKYIIPPFDDLNYDLGSWIEIFNDTDFDLRIEATEDRLESTAVGAIDGPRTMGAGGWGRLVLMDIDVVTWKLNGEQIT